jgi:hypothetical protein
MRCPNVLIMMTWIRVVNTPGRPHNECSSPCFLISLLTPNAFCWSSHFEHDSTRGVGCVNSQFLTSLLSTMILDWDIQVYITKGQTCVNQGDPLEMLIFNLTFHNLLGCIPPHLNYLDRTPGGWIKGCMNPLHKHKRILVYFQQKEKSVKTRPEGKKCHTKTIRCKKIR